jgi:hypothetical protein
VNAEYQTFTQQMEEFSVFDVNREAQDADSEKGQMDAAT